MILTNKQLSFAYLNLCEQITGKKRNTITVEFSRNGLKTYSPDDVETYLRGRIEEIPEKVKEIVVETKYREM